MLGGIVEERTWYPMVDRSWFVVALFLCLLLVPLVWGAQRLLNTFHPREEVRQANALRLLVLLRLLLLLLLWLAVATLVAALPLSYVLAMPRGVQSLSSSLLDWMLRGAVLVSGGLILALSARNAQRQLRRHRQAATARFRRRLP